MSQEISIKGMLEAWEKLKADADKPPIFVLPKFKIDELISAGHAKRTSEDPWYAVLISGFPGTKVYEQKRVVEK